MIKKLYQRPTIGNISIPALGIVLTFRGKTKILHFDLLHLIFDPTPFRRQLVHINDNFNKNIVYSPDRINTKSLKTLFD